jgi:CRISPR system Cascade subunit CasE
MNESLALHMLKLPIDERRLHTFAAAQGLFGAHETDDGYMLHALLAALFGATAPKPFAAQRGKRRPLTLLAYAAAPVAAFEETARLQAAPDVYQTVDWRAAASKPMPTGFQAGQRLGFRVHVLPLIRAGRAHPVFKPGAEVDAFLAAAEADRAGAKPDRDAIYRQWLADRLARHGATLHYLETLARRRVTLIRKRAGGGRQRLTQHPELDLDGTLVVTDAAAFLAGLARGIGRHRAFGYGMLLLRPADG